MQKEADLILGEPDATEEIDEVEIVPSSDYEYLMSAVNALECMDGGNFLTKDAQRIANRIKRKSLKIIDYIITNMHDELFDEEIEEEN